jgi:hypothetical protein
VFERFTDRARHILVLALDEATRLAMAASAPSTAPRLAAARSRSQPHTVRAWGADLATFRTFAESTPTPRPGRHEPPMP